MTEPETQAAAPREKGGCVVGTSFGLLFIVLLLFLIIDPGGSMGTSGQLLDPTAELETQFVFASLPFELEADAAAKLPGGDRVVRLSHPDYRKAKDELERIALLQPEPEAGELAGSETGEGAMGSGGMPGGFEPWMPPELEYVEGQAPTEVFFVFPKAPAGVVSSYRGESASRGGGGGGGGRGGRGGGGGMPMGGMMMAGPGKPIPIDGGDLDWGTVRVGYRHERTFGTDTATDEIRVNLSESGRYCVLFVRWPENHAGSVERVEELLAAFSRVEL